MVEQEACPLMRPYNEVDKRLQDIAEGTIDAFHSKFCELLQSNTTITLKRLTRGHRKYSIGNHFYYRPLTACLHIARCARYYNFYRVLHKCLWLWKVSTSL